MTTNYTRTYNPQPTQRVGSAELVAEFQAIENGFGATSNETDRTLRQTGGSAVDPLPNAISRALKVLSFDASGNPRTTIAETDLAAAVTAAATATTQAGISTTQAGISTTQAGISTTKAAEAAASAVAALASENAAELAETNAGASASAASASASTATAQAGIAATQAGLATTNGAAQVALAAAQVSLATTQANTATTQAGIATTQAGIATTQAGLATTNGAAQVALAAAQVSLATTQANTATTQASTATTKASEADASAIAAAASAASIAPGSLLTAANPSYTGTLTGGTGVVNLGSGQFTKDANGIVGFGTASPGTWSIAGGRAVFGAAGSNIYGAANDLILSTNADYNSSWKYVATGGAAYYEQYGGTHNWYGAASGSAGAVISGFSAAKMTLDTAGNFGLGVTPSAWGGGKGFQVEKASVFGAASLGGFASNLYLADAGANYRCIANGTVALYLQNVAGDHRWSVGSGTAGNTVSTTTAMTLDASGRLGLGVPAPTLSFEVGQNAAKGYLQSGVGVFSIGSSTSHPITLDVAGSERVRIDTSGNLTPGGDNTQTNGSGAKRWSVIYAGTGTINTSDAREKTDVRVMAADEIEAAKALSKEIGVYQFLDSVAAKGDKARHHIGMTVQRAIEIMKHHGLDPFSYGFICHDKWGEETKEHPAVEAREAVEAKDAVLDDEGNVVEPAVEAQPAIEAKDAWTEVTLKAGDRYSFRYDQLTLFIARGLHAEIEAMQAQIDAQNTAMQLLASRLAALEAAA